MKNLSKSIARHAKVGGLFLVGSGRGVKISVVLLDSAKWWSESEMTIKMQDKRHNLPWVKRSLTLFGQTLFTMIAKIPAFLHEGR